MNIEFVPEIQNSKSTSGAINALLSDCFPEEDYEGRDYYKQLPHYRLLAYQEDRLVGHLGVDLRMMNLNGQAITVLGAIDLCVCPDVQGGGIGTKLLERFEAIARDAERVDFLLLAAKNPAIYERLGYQRASLRTKWLKIHRHENYGLGDEQTSDALLLYKSISGVQWKDGELDLLGYWY